MPMSVSKAIEILTTYMKGSDEAEPGDFDDAVILGIEALKAVKWSREQEGPYYIADLPGETDA